MRTLRAFLAIVALVSLVPRDAGASIQYLSINWDPSTTKTINYRFDGVLKSITISAATGYLDSNLDGLFSAPGRTLPRAFCVDLFHSAFDSDLEPGHNHEYGVRERTGADGTAGWVTPADPLDPDDTDRWRDQGSLGRTAWVANTYGRSAGLTGVQKVALNVVIWKAAYGARFQYVSGLTPGAQLTAYNTYMAGYNQGYSTGAYRWYDNNYGDTEDFNQDFIEPVPEPGTLLLLGTGLLGAGGLTIRRRSRKA